MEVLSSKEQNNQPYAELAGQRYDMAAFNELTQWFINGYRQPEFSEMAPENFDNARTSLFEGLTASGHLSTIELTGDQAITNGQVLRRLLNGWSEKLPAWEKQRRFLEIREELIAQQLSWDILAGLMPEDTMIVTLSDFPEAATTAELAWRHGYRYGNKKGMVRVMHFERQPNGSMKRVIEQISRSHSNDGSSARLVGRFGAAINSSADALGAQMLANRQVFYDGAVTVQMTLDSFRGVHYGNETSNPHHPDYEHLRRVSKEREAQAEIYYPRLAQLEAHLNEKMHSSEITYNQKLAIYNQERERIIDEICLLNPDYAVDARGKLAAKYYRKASLAMAAGNHEQGKAYLQQGKHASDPYASPACGGAGEVSGTGAYSDEISGIYDSAKENRKDWKWKRGRCVVKTCATRPSETEVGPCNVCRHCQAKFDKGEDPTKTIAAPSKLREDKGQEKSPWMRMMKIIRSS